MPRTKLCLSLWVILSVGTVCYAAKGDKDDGDPTNWGSAKKIPTRNVHDSRQHILIIPNPDEPIQLNGKIKKWFYWASNKEEEVMLQVYRATGRVDLEYELVGQLRHTSKKSGKQSVTLKRKQRIDVRVGDVIGLFTGNATVKYSGTRSCGDTSSKNALGYLRYYAPYIGNVFKFFKLLPMRCRTYPIKVKIEESTVVPGPTQTVNWPLRYYGNSLTSKKFEKETGGYRSGMTNHLVIPKPEDKFTTNRMLTEFRFSVKDTPEKDVTFRLFVLRPKWLERYTFPERKSYEIVYTQDYTQQKGEKGIIKVPIEPPFPANVNDVIGLHAKDLDSISNYEDKDCSVTPLVRFDHMKGLRIGIQFSLNPMPCRVFAIGVMWHRR